MQNIHISLPLLHLGKSRSRKPHKGIKPCHTSQSLQRQAFYRMAMAHMACLVCYNLFTLARSISRCEKYRSPKREWFSHGIVFSKCICFTKSELRTLTQTLDKPQLTRHNPHIEHHYKQIYNHHCAS